MADDFTDKAQRVVEDIRNQVGESTDTMREAADETVEKARDKGQELRNGFDEEEGIGNIREDED